MLDAWIDTLRKQIKCRSCKGTGRTNPQHSQTCTCGTHEHCENCGGAGYTLGCASYKSTDRPAHIPDVTNEERSAVEVYEFLRDKPRKYTAYVKLVDWLGTHDAYGDVHTWTGDVLGYIGWVGPEYRVRGFGRTSIRQNLRVRGINGLVYSAVYYKSSGDYCRMKAFKTL